MLLPESEWFRDFIITNVPNGSTVANIGSSTKEFIENKQPYIRDNILVPLTAKGCRIINIDIKPEEGVDLVGDILQPDFREKVKAEKPDFIFCSNLLEHVPDKDGFISAIKDLATDSAVLVVSGPFKFPYHKDPIDNMYRPKRRQLVNDFAPLKIQSYQIVSGGLYFKLLAAPYRHKAVFFVKSCLRLLFNVFTLRLKSAAIGLWMFRKVSVFISVFTV